MARSLAARAFTLGNDIVFAPGRHEPGSDSGRRLLAHELAHVVSGGAENTVARAPDAGVAPDAAAAAAGPSDAGVPLPAGVPAAPTPLFDGLFGSCLTPEEGVRRDAFALRHMHLERYIPSTTFGMFDADYFPLIGLMPITVKMKFNFVSADNAPGMMEWMRRTMAGEDLSRFFWSDTERPISRATTSAAWPRAGAPSTPWSRPSRAGISVPFRWSCRSRWMTTPRPTM